MAKKQAVKNKSVLGKGMASLIGDKATLTPSTIPAFEKIKPKTKAPTEELAESNPMVSVSEISANPHQPRKEFKEEDLKDLSASIKESGVIQPLIVTKKKDTPGFELIAGERRLRAAKMAGLKHVPVVIKKATEKDKMAMAIVENVQRSDLNCIEEALAYFRLMEEFGTTQEEVAKQVGKERPTIANRLRLLKLPREIVEFLRKEQLSAGHGKLLCSVKERELSLELARSAIEKNMSVKELSDLISASKKVKRTKEAAPENSPEFDDKIERLREKLEQRTGFHYKIKSSQQGQGQFLIKFSNEAEFNDVFEFLMRR